MATTTARIPSRSGVTSVTLTPNGATTGEPAASYAPTAIDTDVLWEFEIPEALTGYWWWVAKDASGKVRGRGPIYLEDTASTFRADEVPSKGATAEQIATELNSLVSDPLATGPKPADMAAITLYRGTTWERSFSGLGDRTGWSKVLLTIKRQAAWDDAEAALQVQRTSGDDDSDGVLRVNGAVATSEEKARGQLTVTAASPAVVQLRALASLTSQLLPGVYVADLKFFASTGDLAAERIELPIAPFQIRIASAVTQAV